MENHRPSFPGFRLAAVVRRPLPAPTIATTLTVTVKRTLWTVGMISTKMEMQPPTTKHDLRALVDVRCRPSLTLARRWIPTQRCCFRPRLAWQRCCRA
uniref:Uncharacterized protein n=1 Tax=Anopheles funestus TaxID=62324 RepID=A0A182S4C1_ANOFN